MTWTIGVRHGEAVAEQSERIVALDASQPYRLRLWSYDYRTGRDFIETRWINDPAWRMDPRFAGIDAILPDMIKAHPGLTGTERMGNLRRLP